MILVYNSRMNIKFNEVTWYSKLGAVVLFLLIVPILTFIVGRQYQETVDILKSSGSARDSATSASQFHGMREGAETAATRGRGNPACRNVYSSERAGPSQGARAGGSGPRPSRA